MIDYVCKYAPVEILAGFGVESRLCNPVSERFATADRLTHRNMCSFSRALIDSRMESDCGALLLTNCCDSIRRVCDVLQTEGQDVFLLNLPHQEDHCSRLLYKNELLDFIKRFAAYSGKSFDCESFKAACGKTGEGPVGPYVAVMGARMNGELLEQIRKSSPLPIRDNTCVGARHIGKAPGTNDLEALMQWYAGELLSQIPCMRMTDIAARRALAEDPNIQGIVYHTVKFCDFYGFEYAQLKRSLSIPLLKIETDYTLQSSAQLQNRVEAFFEGSGFSVEGKKMRKGNSRDAEKRYVAGIDSGSTSTNALILDGNRTIVSFSTLPTGVDVAKSARMAFDDALKKARLSKNQISRTVATGYGRANTGLACENITEITCHAKGAYFLHPAVRTVIDIGGQDSKVIRLDAKGAVKDFTMNDKCAAGTGRFLEMMAQSLGLTLEEIGTRGVTWKEEITITSMCSVFAQSEVVSLIAAGKKLEDIVHGLDLSVASKVIALGGRAKLERECMMTGGVAKNRGVVRAIEEKLGHPVCLPEEPEICGALGAALTALED